ncbi:chemosensory receptor a [Plakobranchus ocellatus]|uniref:Chemosensory receptor a n=1 Tax=Plakobranchus ocellatus TaxID=259542 RepID=A0AAV4A9W3_9GAST|nr:chemosensory receptor a [Plakobranchus ocellatus]
METTMNQEMENHTHSSASSEFNPELTTELPLYIQWRQVDGALIYPIVPILFFSVLGVGTNILNILVFIKMGLQETTTISMLALAVSDLICCIMAFWTYLCYVPAFRDMPGLPFQSVEVSLETGQTFRPYVIRTGALITAFITLERCLCVVIPLKVKNIITLSATRVLIVVIYIITIVPYIAHPMLYQLDWKFYPYLNRSLVGAVYKENPLAILFMLIASYLCGFFYLLLATSVVIVCTLFLVINLLRSSRWRESMRKQTGASTAKSADMKTSSSRREDRLIKQVVVIAILFIICTTPGAVSMFIIAVSKDFVEKSRFYPSTLVLQGYLFAFETVNNSVNFFVYYVIGTKFRLVFRQMIGVKENTASS